VKAYLAAKMRITGLIVGAWLIVIGCTDTTAPSGPPSISVRHLSFAEASPLLARLARSGDALAEQIATGFGAKSNLPAVAGGGALGPGSDLHANYATYGSGNDPNDVSPARIWGQATSVSASKSVSSVSAGFMTDGMTGEQITRIVATSADFPNLLDQTFTSPDRDMQTVWDCSGQCKLQYSYKSDTYEINGLPCGGTLGASTKHNAWKWSVTTSMSWGEASEGSMAAPQRSEACAASPASPAGAGGGDGSSGGGGGVNLPDLYMPAPPAYDPPVAVPTFSCTTTIWYDGTWKRECWPV
jgi:hypothetical protein